MKGDGQLAGAAVISDALHQQAHHPRLLRWRQRVPVWCAQRLAIFQVPELSEHDLLQAGRRDEFTRTSAALLAGGAKVITIAFAAVVGRMRRRHAAAARRTVEKSFQQSSKTIAGQSAFGVTMTAQRFLHSLPQG